MSFLNLILYFVIFLVTLHFVPGACNVSARRTYSGTCQEDIAFPCHTPKFICYFTNWSTNRTGNSQFKVSNIPTNTPCTHIIYSFAHLNPKSLTMEFSILEIDAGSNSMVQQVTALRSKGIKVMVALGGWADSENGTKYSQMINHGFARTNFVHETVKFLRKYNFDGLDLDWEYPKCWWGNCSTTGPMSDKNNFANLVQELKIAFEFYGLLVSVAVAGDLEIAKQSYDMVRIGQWADWIGVMTYDLHSTTSAKTGHHSAYMGPHPNTVDALELWMTSGVPASKIVMGIALYGRSYTLADVSLHGVGAPITRPGKPGSFTREDGFLAYFEFCDKWSYKEISGVGNYAVRGDQWVSFNDVGLIAQKMKHVLQYHLGGIMAWAIDLDDFNGDFCNQGMYPLITAMSNALSSNTTN